MASMSTITIKRGDDYAQGGVRRTSTGAPVDLTGYTASAEIRTVDGELVGAFTIAIDPGSGGTFRISASASETAAWPPGVYVSDLRFRAPSGVIRRSPTFRVRVVGHITE